MEKIPCIECNSELWKYIKPFLEGWRYSHFLVCPRWDIAPLLVINSGGRLGFCDNYSISHSSNFNRELVTDVEEFLQRAAELKGFTYKRKDIMEINGIEIKPGMVIGVKYNQNEVPTSYVVFPLKTKGLGVVQYGKSSKYPYGCWENINSFYSENKDIIEEIRDLPDGGFLHSGKTLWEKPKEVIISIEELAKQYKCKPEQIKIVK